MSINDVFLPKYPQLIIEGGTITTEEVKDIILRTDPFFLDVGPITHPQTGFVQSYRRESGIAQMMKDAQKYGHAWPAWAIRALRETIGAVYLKHLKNQLAASIHPYGPFGWVQPSGRVMFTHSISGWPSVNTVLCDFQAIASNFPYLKLKASLYDQEETHRDDDKIAVANFEVSNGQAIQVETDWGLLRNHPTPDLLDLIRLEHPGIGLPLQWYQELAKRVRSVIESPEFQTLLKR